MNWLSVLRRALFRELALYVLFALLLFVGALLVTSCSPARGSDARAVEIPAPVGVACYAILDGEGRAVGGSCLRL